MRPRIGVTTSLSDDEQRLHRAYVDSIVAAGGLPLPLPMLIDRSLNEELVGLIDGLVITGGPAIVQGMIGDLPGDISETHEHRSRSDDTLLDLVLPTGKPVLGICYGMQLLNARFGGTIYADVQQQRPGTDVHSSVRGGTSHPIHFNSGTLLYDLLHSSITEVNTRHIQSVAMVADEFRISAVASDGVVEAIESKEGRLIGLQFHPERMGEAMQPLFRHFVGMARQVANAASAKRDALGVL